MNWWFLRRKYHVSWFIAFASAALIVGVFWSQHLDQTWFASPSWLFLGVLLILLACFKHQLLFIPLVITGGLFVGIWRGSIEQSQLAVYENLYEAQVSLDGIVSEDVSVGKKGELILRLNQNSINNHGVSGTIWVTLDSNADIKRGDIITASGKLQTGFGNIAAAIYHAELKNVRRPEPGDVARQVRDWFASAVRQSVHEPEASLGIGFLVGQRRTLPPELSDALKIAGLTHVVVASGYNLTILVRFARRLFEKVSKYLSTFLASSMIVGFVAITGLSPSMSRAGLIAGLSLAAWYYGRKFHPLVLLPFAAAITLLFNPSFAWGDLGWQLSFAAFAGVMILAPLAQAYFFDDKKPGSLRQILGETMAAQLATLPLLIMMFGQFSNVAVIANILILPLVPLAMLLTFISGLGALVAPAPSQLIGLPATWLLDYMTSVTEYLASLPWALNQVSFGMFGVSVFYAAIIMLCVFMWWKTKFNLRDANIVE